MAALYIDHYATGATFVLLANQLLLNKEEKFEDTKEVNRQSEDRQNNDQEIPKR